MTSVMMMMMMVVVVVVVVVEDEKPDIGEQMMIKVTVMALLV